MYGHSTLGNSYGHTHSSLILMLYLMFLFLVSTCPLAWGCTRDEKAFFMPKLAQRDQNLGLSNCFPFSIMSVSGMPNREMMFFHTNLVLLAARILANGIASTHLMK